MLPVPRYKVRSGGGGVIAAILNCALRKVETTRTSAKTLNKKQKAPLTKEKRKKKKK
jgi:hypothetical protein